MKKPRLSTIFKAAVFFGPLIMMGKVAYDNKDIIFPSSTDTTIDTVIADIVKDSAPTDIINRNPSIIPIIETTCDNTEEKFQNYCYAALRTQEKTGFDAVIMMYKIAMETGFRPLPENDLKPAQGPLQIQPAYLIDKLFQHGLDLPFMQQPENADALEALMVLRSDSRIRTASGQRELADIMHESFKNKDFKENPHLEILSKLRDDIDFSMQLVALATLDHTPNALVSDFSDYSPKSIQARQDIALEAYLAHNAGLNGARYQAELMTNPDYAQLRPADKIAISEAIESIQAEFNYPDIRSNTLIKNAEANPAVFVNGAETQYGCLGHDLSNTMSLHMGSFLHTLNTANTISLFTGHAGLEEDTDLPFDNTIDIISATFHSDTAPTTSLRPLARPNIIVTRIPETDISRVYEQSWHQMNCGIQDTSHIIGVSPRPKLRPERTMILAQN